MAESAEEGALPVPGVDKFILHGGEDLDFAIPAHDARGNIGKVGVAAGDGGIAAIQVFHADAAWTGIQRSRRSRLLLFLFQIDFFIRKIIYHFRLRLLNVF